VRVISIPRKTLGSRFTVILKRVENCSLESWASAQLQSLGSREGCCPHSGGGQLHGSERQSGNSKRR
jgi:hypothetical protein